jgi:hypothetical protein
MHANNHHHARELDKSPNYLIVALGLLKARQFLIVALGLLQSQQFLDLFSLLIQTSLIHKKLLAQCFRYTTKQELQSFKENKEHK